MSILVYSRKIITRIGIINRNTIRKSIAHINLFAILLGVRIFKLYFLVFTLKKNYYMYIIGIGCIENV